MAIKAKIPSQYRPIFTDNYLYYVFYGGRGGGKTENIAQSLIILSLQRRVRILCIRESQSSLAESVKAVLEKWIFELNVHEFFTIKHNTIENVAGSEFIFSGMRSHNAVSVKSISGINITWIEEAEAFSKRSWQLLVPSVTRTINPKIIISFNPYKEDDVIYSEFISHTPPKNSYICYVNYYDNPFFKDSVLDQQRIDDKQRIPEAEYNHKWLGKLVTFSEDSIFKDCDFEVLETIFDEGYYVRKVIACDPATTDKEYSNEYGVVVVGKTISGDFHIIDDFSGNYSPLEFTNAVVRAKNLYNTNNVVVEVNNGGDFIKAMLIQNDPTLNVIEVRAGSDKIQRALPVANLMSIHKIKFTKKLPNLIRQMRLMTYQGFKGSKGESPDRLDACAWGIYELAEIKSRDSIYTLFKKEYTDYDVEWIKQAYCVNSNVMYLYCSEGKIAMILIDLYRSDNVFKFIVRDSAIVEKLEDIDVEYSKAFCLENGYSQGLINQHPEITPFTIQAPRSLDEKASVCLPIIKTNRYMLDPLGRRRKYLNTEAFLLEVELMEFKLDSNKSFLLLELFFAIIFLEEF